MKNSLDIPTQQKILAPVVFRSYFNQFEQLVSSPTWPFPFSGSQKDKLLKLGLELGRFFNYLLIALTVVGIFKLLVFNNSGEFCLSF